MDAMGSQGFSPDAGYRYKMKRNKDDRDRDYGRSRRSRSRSRSRERYGRSRRSRTRSRSRSRSRTRNHSYDKHRSSERDSYKDSGDDYHGDRDKGYYSHRERDRRDRDGRSRRRSYSPNFDDEYDSHDSDTGERYTTAIPYNKIIVRGLAQHITEADISSDLMQYGLKPVSIRLIRRKKTGASRGFAFVEFNTEQEATRWMDYKQGILMLQDQYRAVMQYSITKEPPCVTKDKYVTDWYCAKCGVLNFKRRDNCFKCYASREESEKGGEGSDEVSNILTKKIMLRNLDVLTNEEGVLTVMQEVVPTLVSKISKILICRDPLTSTSRGVCYLSFDNLVDSMNTHNALKGLEPPLKIETREVLISYCVDPENPNPTTKRGEQLINSKVAQGVGGEMGGNYQSGSGGGGGSYQYTMDDVPRLAEYSANMYASNSVEHEHYLKYYTQYYMGQISKGQFSNLPTMSQMGGETANSGAAVAQSAIQRKQIAQQGGKYHGKGDTSSNSGNSASMQIPRGTDGKKYPTPDVSLYQYDETSGFYYDPTTGLYYDGNSQYYYNSEINAYLYWDNENSTYVLAPTASQASATQSSSTSNSSGSAAAAASLGGGVDGDGDNGKQLSVVGEDGTRREGRKEVAKQDKVKVAKKIVKDMEKWAKQLNQKKDMNMMAPMAVKEENLSKNNSQSGYADVGFSILEKKEKGAGGSLKFGINEPSGKLVAAYGSDSENDLDEAHGDGATGGPPANEKDYVDFDKLTCLLCKRAFQSPDILQKHLQKSTLHLENMRKYNLGRAADAGNAGQSYRDRALERRMKYGEADPPPPNRSKERFQREIEKQSTSSTAASTTASLPIGQNNVGNKLLQKMGWTEGQGLGRSNQGRTNIIETESRAPTAGLGTKASTFAPGDDYKSYIKRMMKTRYEQVDIKD
ncbi:RNA-binding protein 5-like isoform X2 [Lutzomyia longipalpis]|uniref:RNA-binding protein 5-like isoform X2 n=1 Tax=Lutzomyia longipalpis TaxID=7200 RepID=UPI002483EE86|nr:RNA-binding protein 5-like isoform X2 [Lutzomyia longipalpis]